MSLCRLIYRSRASAGALDQDNLLALLDQCVLSNDLLGITGLLLVTDGHFLQVLEGESEAINDLFQRISRDPRHGEVRLIQYDSVAERRFDSWSMRLVDLRDAPEECLAHLDRYRGTDGTLGIPDDPLDVHALFMDARRFCLAPDE